MIIITRKDNPEEIKKYAHIKRGPMFSPHCFAKCPGHSLTTCSREERHSGPHAAHGVGLFNPCVKVVWGEQGTLEKVAASFTKEIAIGARVKVKPKNIRASEQEYILVGAGEPNISEGRIAVTHPIGQGLLGHKIGDVVKIAMPAGIFTCEKRIITYEILEISYGNSGDALLR